MSDLNGEVVSRLVQSQLERISDADVVASIGKLLVQPYRVDREWAYGDPGTRYACWTVLEHQRSNTGIAYCESGFGPKCPWGLVSITGEESIGADYEWYSDLESAFRESMAWDDGSID